MKKLYFNGNSVNWLLLGVEGAYNTKTGKRELISELPEGKYLKVHLAEDVNANISDGLSARAMRKSKKRDYLILHNGRAVGYATLHNKWKEYQVRVTLAQPTTISVKARNEKAALAKARELATEEVSSLSEDAYVANVELAQ